MINSKPKIYKYTYITLSDGHGLDWAGSGFDFIQFRFLKTGT